jgi:hypothetical protein
VAEIEKVEDLGNRQQIWLRKSKWESSTRGKHQGQTSDVHEAPELVTGGHCCPLGWSPVDELKPQSNIHCFGTAEDGK